MIRLLLSLLFLILLAILIAPMFRKKSKLQDKVAKMQDDLEDAEETKGLLQKLAALKKKKAQTDGEIVKLMYTDKPRKD